MSLCSTSQTSQALAASHSLGPFFPLRLCCQGLSILLGSGTCTGSPPWPDGSRRGWSRGASECWKARESPGISCGTGRSRELQSQLHPGAVVTHFHVTNSVPTTTPSAQVCVAVHPSLLLPLHSSCTAFPALGQQELERLVLVYADLFYPFLWRKLFFPRTKDFPTC